MGLAKTEVSVTSREEAYAVAKNAYSKVADLPRDLECGATLTRWALRRLACTARLCIKPRSCAESRIIQ